MKTKLISKILCGVLAVTTITSSGMMYAGAFWRPFPTFSWGFLHNGTSYPEPKNTDSGVYCYEENGTPFCVRVLEGRTSDGYFSDAHGGSYYDLDPQTDEYLPNYVHEDGCAYAELEFWESEYSTNGHDGYWGPDDR